ncbi:MAG TPA: SDR family oxidoreductase [Anaerolineae bacterium]|nr:SDR family oxidoreductase [Anaerolineae bacterium]
MEIRNRVALVTGGAHRVGKSIALALAAAGAHTVITYLHAVDEAARTRREIEAHGVQGLALQLDQREPAQIAALLGAVRERFSRLDILVNSAAIMERTSIFDITPEDWDRTLDTNLRGPFFMAQAAARMMLENKPGVDPVIESETSRDAAGCIVNISDLSALRPWPSYIAHSVSKAGLVALTRALAVALAPSVRVNAIAPGAVFKPPGWSDERWSRLSRSAPLGRSGTPEDVAQAVLYLTRSEFITGQLLVLDGGRELR